MYCLSVACSLLQANFYYIMFQYLRLEADKNKEFASRNWLTHDDDTCFVFGYLPLNSPQSVADIRDSRNDCRVLVLGSGMGIIPLLALKAGAVHVTVIER